MCGFPTPTLFGEVEQGWHYITNALEVERVALGVPVASRNVVDVHTEFVLSGDVGDADRAVVLRMQAKYEVARLLAFRAGSLIDSGHVGAPLPQMSKVFTTEMRSRFGDDGMTLLGTRALPRHRTTSGRLGEIEFLYRNAPFLRFGGGANEVLRDILFRLAGGRDWTAV